MPLPETLRDALRVRAEGLSDEGRAALETAAVVGVEVELELLAELGRDGGLSEVLDRGLLHEVEPGSRRSGTTSSGKRSTPIRTGQGVAPCTASWQTCSKAAVPSLG